MFPDSDRPAEPTSCTSKLLTVFVSIINMYNLQTPRFRHRSHIRELKQTTTAMATKTSPNKRFNGQARVVRKVDNAISTGYITVLSTLTRWIAIYLVDIALSSLWTNGARTIAMHVRFKSLYISYLSSAKQFPSSAYFGNIGHDRRQIIFSSSFWNWSLA